MPPRPPPCNQYGSEYKLVRPNWRPYCRKTLKKGTTKRAKKTITKTHTEKCSDQPPHIMENFKTLLNLDKNATAKDICRSLKKSIRTGKNPTESQVKQAGYALGIYDKSKSLKEIMAHIEKKLDSELTPPFRKMIRLLRSEGSFKGPQLVLLILHIIRPDGFPEKPPQPLSDKLFNEYVLEKQSGKLMPRDKEALLAQCLTSQLCHCIKSQFLVHKFRYEALMKKPEGPNPYALCQSRTYNKRGIKGINIRSGVCEKRYDWFRRLEKVDGKRIPKFPMWKPSPVKTDKQIKN